MRTQNLKNISASQYWTDYELLDFGGGRRLERFGLLTTSRLDPTTRDFRPVLSQSKWQAADLTYRSATSKIGTGAWDFGERQDLAAVGTIIPWRHDLNFQIKFMPSKHVGLFPEHAPQWEWLGEEISAFYADQFPEKAEELSPDQSQATTDSNPETENQFQLLNLFAYSGGGTLAAAQAGAAVTHVDSSYEAIGLGRANQTLSGLSDAPIRWIKEDVSKFVAREIRRGKKYDGIVLDPPAFGHGTRGENWSTLRDLPRLMSQLQQLLSPRARFLLLNTYALGASADLDYAHRFTPLFESNFDLHQYGQLALTSSASSHSALLTTGQFDFWKKSA